MDVVVTVRLPSDEAEALAQLCKRFGHHHAVMLSSKFDEGRECWAMIDAICALSRALSEIGYAPR